MKATTLEQVIQYFEPREPLSGAKLHAWFIPREGSPRRRLMLALNASAQPQKLLFVGHRGSGKTTELNKLAEEIADRFCTIGFNVLDMTGRTMLEYEDLMLMVSTQVTRYCIEHHLLPRPASAAIAERWQQLRDWWHQVIAGTGISPAPAEQELSVQVGLLLANVEVGMRQSAATREGLKFQINRQMPELIRTLNWVVEQAQTNGQKPLLIVVEGLDKVDLASATSIFCDHAQTLVAPHASIIYTFPTSLRYSDHYHPIRQSFNDAYFFPNLALRNRDGAPHTAGLTALRDLALARLEPHLIEPAALGLLIQASGGLPVSLVALMRKAALYALERDEQTAQITSADARAASFDLRGELMAPLRSGDLAMLHTRHHDHRLTNDSEEQRLFYNGSLIAYRTDDQQEWCDAHSVLWPLLNDTPEQP